MHRTTLYATCLFVFSAIACASRTDGPQHASDPPPADDAALGKRIAEGLLAACPAAAPNDEAARRACAGKLADFTLLRDAMREPFLWGGQKPGTGYALEDSTLTRFNPLVWRKMYLSLNTFSDGYTIESLPDRTVVHLPTRFRNQLDVGSYPYPFWHSKAKWDSYQFSTELLLVLQNGKVVGAMRSQNQDTSRPYIARQFDGNWTWKEGDQDMPSAALYANLFDSHNEAVPKVEAAYRALEEAIRPFACLGCHNPENVAKQNPLELFSYPNQALHSRHNIVRMIEANAMPPSSASGKPGIADPDARANVLSLARAFEAAADEALAREGEITLTSNGVIGQ